MGRSWGFLRGVLGGLRRSWCGLGTILERSWCDRKSSGAHLDRLGPLLAVLGPVLRRSWPVMDRFEVVLRGRPAGICVDFLLVCCMISHKSAFSMLRPKLERSWDVLGRPWGVLEGSWILLGRPGEILGDPLGASWGFMGQSRASLGGLATS